MGTDDTVPSPEAYVDAVFGEHGYLSRAFEGYRPRSGQVALAHAVDRSLRERVHLLAEGPTGTGKSLAYAAPASYHAWTTGKPVVIVTANIALQEQIVGKDLPLLHKLVPWPFTFSLLKGRSNFLCVDRFYDHEAGKHRQTAFGGASAEEHRQLPIVEQWARDCIRAGIHNESGDVSDLPFEPLHTVWRKFSVSSDECKRGRCRSRSECFAIAAKERARTANVIVTNYHMLYAHLAVYQATGLDAVIAPFEAAILDEAHKAADIARNFFGFRITVESVRRLARRLREDEPGLAEALDLTAARFFDVMATLRHDRNRYKARLNGDYSAHEHAAWDAVGDAATKARAVFDARVRKLSAEAESLRARGDGMSDEADDLNDRLGEAENDLDRAHGIAENLRRAQHPNADLRSVYFLEEDEKRRITLSSRLIFARDALGPGLFDKHVSDRRGGDPDDPADVGEGEEGPDPLAEAAPRITVVATSATLATGAGSFAYVADELGVGEGYHHLVAPSPFDWKNQCLFIVPDGMPAPNDEDFRNAVARTVERIVLLAKGRTLGLFTSRKSLEHTYDTIVGSCTRNRIKLWKQGDMPRTKLIEAFKTDVSSTLLGTESFWAGVDVPGESLSVVVIDRLPFPTPDDPVLDALAARDKDWFFKYSVPRAIVAFKQGFGRLVRSLGDRGVVVCLDNRILTKHYGKDFLRALPDPGIPKSTNLDHLVEWLSPPDPPAWDAP